MLYVYRATNEPIPMPDWDKSGHVKFSKSSKICIPFQNGVCLYPAGHPLSGLKWYEVYCLIHLGIEFARHSVNEDVYIWKRMKSEPFPEDTIIIQGWRVRSQK